MEERKSLGGALVDVFDAGVVLVKSEINAIVKKVTEIAKAKGLGIVLVLASVGPLVLGLIFLILWFFYLLRGWGLADSAAAFVIALLSLGLTGALVFLGIQKLGAEVDTDMPRHPVAPDAYAGAAGVAVPAGPAMATPGTPRPGTVPVSDLRYSAAPAGHTSAPHAAADGLTKVRVEGGTETLPVYESKPDGEAAFYGSGLNEKLAHGHDHHDDPNLQNPVVLHNAPGIRVSTDPTYRQDMKKEGQDV